MGRGRREAIIDAAVDAEVARCAQHQRSRLAESTAQGVIAIGLRTLAVAGPVQVAAHGQGAGGIVGRYLAHDLHARPQAHLAQCRSARRQIGVAEGGVHPCLVVRIDHRVQPLLGDQLRPMAIDVRRRCQRGVGIAPEGIDQHIPRAVPRRGTLRVKVPACHAIVLAGRVALCNRGAAAQVNARGTAQHHLAVAAAQLHQRTVAAVDDLAVAVHPQPAAVCIQQSIHLQAVTRGQADASHLLSAGVDGAEHMQAAAIDAERNVARLQRVGHGQVALLELEAAGTEEAARIQLAIQAGEVGKLLRAQQQCAAVIGHRAATGGLATTRATTQGPGQVDAARVLAQRIGGDPPCAVVRCRDVDARTRGGQHVALAGGEFNVAAPAVLVQIVHADATPGQVDAGVAAQHHVAPQFGAQRVVPPGLAGAADAQITPAAYLQGASRRAGQQRCLDVQCAAAVLPTRAGLVGALGLVDIQRALAGELHLVRGPQRDAVEPEHLAVGRHFRTGARSTIAAPGACGVPSVSTVDTACVPSHTSLSE
ncbi:hypothetical protein G6F57_014391 [Rhizopus arrhizus]|nr:hypothetical protein G6F57_014391 [Rhizopus arrhizus]